MLYGGASACLGENDEGAGLKQQRRVAAEEPAASEIRFGGSHRCGVARGGIGASVVGAILSPRRRRLLAAGM